MKIEKTLKTERLNCMHWCHQSCRIVLNMLLPRGGKEMLPVTKQHLLCLAKKKACFLLEILANEDGCARTLAGPVGKGEVCECLCALCV